MTALALILAVAIGLSLGLLGSGGSIVTLPVLVYAAGVPITSAVGMSLAIVGGTSAAAAWLKHRQGLVHGRATMLFGVTGMAGAWVGAQFTRLVPPPVLMLLFAGLMTVIAVRMLAQRGDDTVQPLPDCRPVRCGTAGLVVGMLTGFLGVGGGFLLVPAMILFARLPMPTAVGTSLAVVAANSVAGLAVHLRHGGLDVRTTLVFLAATLLGMLAGVRLGGRVPTTVLRRAFGWLVLAVAGFVIAKNWQALGLTSSSPQP